jgi:hypothetical protein
MLCLVRRFGAQKPDQSHRDTLKGTRPHVTTVVATTPLTALDRCDRCGAQAYMRVELSGGAELLFCAHHAREHGSKLRTIAVTVHDETGKLTAPPVPVTD